MYEKAQFTRTQGDKLLWERCQETHGPLGKDTITFTPMSPLFPFEDNVLSSDLDASVFQRLGREPGSATSKSVPPPHQSEFGPRDQLSHFSPEKVSTCLVLPLETCWRFSDAGKCQWWIQSPHPLPCAWEFACLLTVIFTRVPVINKHVGCQPMSGVHTPQQTEKQVGFGVGCPVSYMFLYCLLLIFTT